MRVKAVYAAAMRAAAELGHTTVLRALMAEGGMVADDCCDARGRSPLWLAAKRGMEEAARVLMAEGLADGNKARPADGTTPVSTAAAHGHTGTVRVLISARADVNIVADDGTTPVSLAAMYGHTDTVRLLIAEGRADVNIADEQGITPVYIASQSGHTEIVRVLIREGSANTNIPDGHGITPLFLAAGEGHTETVQVLILEGNADVSIASTANKETPLYAAAASGHTATVRVLASITDVNIVRADGVTPVYIAAQNGHTETVRALIADGNADVNISRAHDGAMPLHAAAYNGHTATVRVLATIGGSNVNAVAANIHGGIATPLTYAARSNRPGVCFALCALGATITPGLYEHPLVTQHADIAAWLANANSREPLHVALEARDHVVAEHLLLTRRAKATPSMTVQLVDIANRVGTGRLAQPVDAHTVRVAEVATHLYEGRWVEKANALCGEEQRAAVVAVLMIMRRVGRASGFARQQCSSSGTQEEGRRDWQGIPKWMLQVPEDVWWKVLEMTGRW